MGVSLWINVSSWTRKKTQPLWTNHQSERKLPNIKKKQSGIPMKQKRTISIPRIKPKHFTKHPKFHTILNFRVIAIYYIFKIISWFFVCYINTFWFYLGSLRVLNSAVYQDTGQPSSDHGCCPDDSPCCWDPHTWTSRSVHEVRHPTWTPLPPQKNGAGIFNMAKNVYKNVSAHISAKAKTPNINTRLRF